MHLILNVQDIKALKKNKVSNSLFAMYKITGNEVFSAPIPTNPHMKWKVHRLYLADFFVFLCM